MYIRQKRHFGAPAHTIIDQDGVEIADVSESKDANLIASAPDLLEALQEILQLPMLSKQARFRMPTTLIAVEQAESAIAKATGKPVG